MLSIGVIGLGIMGRRCALKLKEHGFQIAGYDAFPAASRKAAEEGIALLPTPAAVASASDVVIMFVPGPEESISVGLGRDGLIEGISEAKIVLNMSTVDPATNERLAAAFAEKKAYVLDSPVLGSPEGIGHWAFAIGGEEEAYARIRHVLLPLCGSEDRIFRTGGIGSANKLKLLNNMLLGTINAGISEIFALAEHMGLSPQTLFRAAKACKGRVLSLAYEQFADRTVRDEYEDPIFSLAMLIKDNKLCLDMARANNAPLIVATAVDYLHRIAAAHPGYGSLDSSIAWKSVKDSWEK
ncbi:MAG: NAD(P)-dependent oxidoreductase [Desulfovibrionaceae bacterium]|nr:NAD(P)-dependent oxidoreductase [Desulfovibrionaceae bacterium]